MHRPRLIAGAAVFPENAVVVFLFEKSQDLLAFVIVSPAAIFLDESGYAHIEEVSEGS